MGALTPQIVDVWKLDSRAEEAACFCPSILTTVKLTRIAFELDLDPGRRSRWADDVRIVGEGILPRAGGQRSIFSHQRDVLNRPISNGKARELAA